MKDVQKMTVYEIITKDEKKSFIYSMPTNDLGFSYHIITTDENNKPYIKKIEKPIERINFERLTPIQYGSDAYKRFINQYAAIKHEEKKNSGVKLTFKP